VTKIAALETQVQELSSQVEKLSNENGSLLKKSRHSERPTHKTKNNRLLSSLMAKLPFQHQREGQDDFRDVDSIFMQYDKNVDGLKDVGNKKLRHTSNATALSAHQKSIVDTSCSWNDLVDRKDLATLVGEQKSSQQNGKGSVQNSRLFMSHRKTG